MTPVGSTLLLDLETTGLSKVNDTIVCLGFYCTETSECMQHVCSKNYSEKCLLETSLTQLASYQSLYVYQNFDLDFLLARLRYHGIDTNLFQTLKVVVLDKVPVFKRLKSCGYSTRAKLDSALDYKRTCQTSGRELARLGQLLLEQAPHSIYESVLKTHNEEELLGLAKYYHFYRFMISLGQKTPVGTKKADCVILDYPHSASSQLAFDFDLDKVRLTALTSIDTFRLTFKVQTLSLRRYLYPAKDYVYIASEGQLVHKSIAQFFPSSMKEKVSQADCFLTQEHPALSLLYHSKEQLGQWVDEAYNVYLPLNEVTDFTLLHQKAYKYLTQG